MRRLVLSGDPGARYFKTRPQKLPYRSLSHNAGVLDVSSTDPVSRISDGLQGVIAATYVNLTQAAFGWARRRARDSSRSWRGRTDRGAWDRGRAPER